MQTAVEYEYIYKERCDKVEQALSGLFDVPAGEIPELLAESMRYSLLAGGKRLRAVLVLSAAELFADGYEAEAVSAEAMPYACAVEMIHTYSLIHDDMPCMDDDDLRRGRKTNHIVYGEGQAMLAGDGLLTYAFEHMLAAAASCPHQNRAISAMRAIANGAGIGGMVAGQCVDLLYERGKGNASREQALSYIQEKKTAALITAALQAGAYIVGAGATELEAVTGYGKNLGVAFQIVDDILDIEGDATVLGKPINSDIKNAKLTHPALYGLDKAKADAREFQEAAIASICDYPRSAFLIELARRQTARVK